MIDASKNDFAVVYNGVFHTCFRYLLHQYVIDDLNNVIYKLSYQFWMNLTRDRCHYLGLCLTYVMENKKTSELQDLILASPQVKGANMKQYSFTKTVNCPLCGYVTGVPLASNWLTRVRACTYGFLTIRYFATLTNPYSCSILDSGWPLSHIRRWHVSLRAGSEPH